MKCFSLLTEEDATGGEHAAVFLRVHRADVGQSAGGLVAIPPRSAARRPPAITTTTGTVSSPGVSFLIRIKGLSKSQQAT